MSLSNPQALVDLAAHKRKRLLSLLAAANVAVALLLAALVYLVLSSSRDSYTTQARQTAEGLVAIAQVNIASELGRVDSVIRSTAKELEALQSSDNKGTDRDLQEVLRTHIALLKGVEALRFSDAEGRIRWGNALPAGAPMNVTDRDYFKAAVQQTSDATIVSGPLQSRVSGNWIMVFVRPVRVNGLFNGIVYVTISADHFRQIFDRYDLADQDSMSLRHQDFKLLARRAPGSKVQGEVGSVTVSPLLIESVKAHPASGSFISKVIVDGIERTTAYRAVEGWPLVVYAGISNVRYFKPWVREAWTISCLATLAWGLVAMAIYLVFRASSRESVAMHALAGQTRRTHALLRIAGDGIHIMDHRGHLVEMSDSFAEMLHSSRELLLGRHISRWDVNQDEAKIDAWLAKIKDGDRQRVDVQHRRDDGSVIDVELQMRVAQIEGELMIFCSGRDVTEIKRLLREQHAMLESDVVGMVKLEQRRVTWCNRAFEQIFGYAPGQLLGQAVHVLYGGEDAYREFGERAYATVNSGQQFRSQIRMRKKSGEAVWIDLSGTRLTDTLSFWMTVDISAMKEVQEDLAHVAFHDPLTQLPNRLLLAERMKQGLAVAKREATSVAVCYLDLDGFKAVNDQLGHDSGDALLVEVAQRLSSSIRPSDTVARLGGDEFVLVLTSLAGDEWRRVLDRVVEAVCQPVELPGGRTATVGVTVGVALSSVTNGEAQELLDQADQAMLVGKRAGKNRICLAPTGIE